MLPVCAPGFLKLLVEEVGIQEAINNYWCDVHTHSHTRVHVHTQHINFPDKGNLKIKTRSVPAGHICRLKDHMIELVMK